MALSQEQIYNTSTASPQYESSVLKREERIIAFRLQNLKAEMTVLEHDGGGGGGGGGETNMRVHSRKIVFSLEQVYCLLLAVLFLSGGMDVQSEAGFSWHTAAPQTSAKIKHV